MSHIEANDNSFIGTVFRQLDGYSSFYILRQHKNSQYFNIVVYHTLDGGVYLVVGAELLTATSFIGAKQFRVFFLSPKSECIFSIILSYKANFNLAIKSELIKEGIIL